LPSPSWQVCHGQSAIGAARPHSHDTISRPYLSTLQPQAGQVQPPHRPSCIDEGLRTNGNGVPQRGQLRAARERPQRPFAFVCCQINPARATKTMRTIIANVISHSTRTNAAWFRHPSGPMSSPATYRCPSRQATLTAKAVKRQATSILVIAGSEKPLKRNRPQSMNETQAKSPKVCFSVPKYVFRRIHISFTVSGAILGRCMAVSRHPEVAAKRPSKGDGRGAGAVILRGAPTSAVTRL